MAPDLPSGTRPMGQALEERLHPTIAFLILPLFAFFNAGVGLHASVAHTLVRPVGLGIVVGLVLGKQIGIMLFGWLAVRTGWATRPDGVTWAHLYGGACLGGVGFTMALFLADLAFRDEGLTAEAKVAILVASLLAAAWGAVMLHLSLPRAPQPL
jgi:NhaA family Na+:H+ antiporter